VRIVAEFTLEVAERLSPEILVMAMMSERACAARACVRLCGLCETRELLGARWIREWRLRGRASALIVVVTSRPVAGVCPTRVSVGTALRASFPHLWSRRQLRTEPPPPHSPGEPIHGIHWQMQLDIPIPGAACVCIAIYPTESIARSSEIRGGGGRGVAAAPTRATPPAIHDRPYTYSAMRRGPIKCSESFEPVPCATFCRAHFFAAERSARIGFSLSTSVYEHRQGLCCCK
jgi:hypothetical protein